MPFTISHAAAVLPWSHVLNRWRLLSAAVIGSMVPDFGLFTPWQPARFETHSLTSLVTFCLPMGMITFWIFQRLVKRSVMSVLPDAAYARWLPLQEPADFKSLRQWTMAAVGIVAGALTHLVWDGFTHEGARGVRMIPALDEPMLDIAGHHLVGTRLWQDLSSLIGLAVVVAIVAYCMRPNDRPAQVAPRRPLGPGARIVWTAIYVAVALAATSAFVIARHLYSGSSLHSLASWAVSALRGLGFAIITVSLAVSLRLKAR